MRKNLLILLSCIGMLVFNLKSSAQGTLIDYWNFNTAMAAMHTDTIHGIDADFSIHDTSKAKILYAEIPGTSATFTTYVDDYTPTTSDYDTVNARLGAPAGFALRTRNPSDSMALLFYIPSVHYTHILLQYGCESSSNGMHNQIYSYSIDSGATWRTAGLSVTTDTVWEVFHRISVSLAMDSLVKNNDKLVFRVMFESTDTGTSGNDRFDNVTVEGDSIESSTVSIAATPPGSICAGTSVHFAATPVIGTSNTHAYYTWYVNGVSAGTDSTGFTTNTLTAGSLVKCVLADSLDGSVLATSNVMTITVTPLPAIAPISGPSNVCPSGTITLTDDVSGGTWTASNVHASISSVGVVTGNTSGADTITYQVINTCGTNDTTFVVAVSTTPSPGVIGGPGTICIGIGTSLSETISGGTWSVSNTNAAISTSGVISGITSGADTVIYTVSTCGTATATYPVTLIPAPVAGSISGTSSLCVDSSATLAETETGGTWATSNTDLTITSAGVILAVAAGIDTVTYSVSNACATLSATQVITVNAPVNPGIISGADTVCVGDTVTLSETVIGGGWEAINGNASVTLLGGTVTGISVGVDTIGYGFLSPCLSYTDYIITVTPACPTAVNALNTVTGALKVYPNPSKGTVTVYCPSPVNESAVINISNIIGEKVEEINIPANQAYELSLDAPDGVYLISALTAHGTFTAKIILQH